MYLLTYLLTYLLQVFLALSNDFTIHAYDYYEAALKVRWMASVSTAEMVLWSVHQSCLDLQQK